MKVILIGNFPVCLSLYQYLYQNKYLQAVCTQHVPHQQSDQDYLSLIQQEKIETFVISSQNISNQFKDWLQAKSPDLVIVYGFSLKIPEKALSIPKHGFLNIHFGKLPENRGPDPLFWSIKNGENKTAITIHQMDKNWDTGKILIEEPIAIIPGETAGMVNSKMNFTLVQLIEKALGLIQNPENYKTQSSKEKYNKRPSTIEISINWEEQTADEIENLINACNPKYGGATTYYQGAPIKIIEVSPADYPATLIDKSPGEIVHVHPHEGLFVYCKDKKLLRVNIIHSDAGVLTGQKYFYLGVQQNHHFTTRSKTKHLIT
ncbi:methionyl-tRNA formyltransferase [Aquimarina aquimarini]|uniref:methionyl-tRNA formyltransferase n=1 Tax=Aquimarina aquimarini TaxID=1191734 RepID=UPI000D54CB69|nr:formyltransferase family protein [Aquimarina aquimarini]